MKTLTDGSAGFNITLFGRFDLGNGMAIRPRWDGTAAIGKPQSVPSPIGTLSLNGKAEITASFGSLGGDFLYYLDGTTRKGIYVGAGLAMGNSSLDFEVPKTTIGNTTIQVSKQSYSAWAPVYGLYAGYQFSAHWNTELSFRSTQFKKTIDGLAFNYSYPVIVLAAGYTF